MGCQHCKKGKQCTVSLFFDSFWIDWVNSTPWSSLRRAYKFVCLLLANHRCALWPVDQWEYLIFVGLNLWAVLSKCPWSTQLLHFKWIHIKFPEILLHFGHSQIKFIVIILLLNNVHIIIEYPRSSQVKTAKRQRIGGRGERFDYF